jgi:short-subunit dehydrogenase
MFSEAPSTASKIFYPEMVARKSGHIILTGSQAGMVPDWVTEHGPYTSAKAAVHALGTALRPEAEEHGVGVATVIVAGTLTDIVKSERSRPEKYGGEGPKATKKREAGRIPPRDVAEMML